MSEQLKESFPSDWSITNLDSITSKIGDGIHSTPIYSENGKYSFINGNNLDKGKISIDELTKKLSEQEFNIHKRNLNYQTILLSINGTIGKLALYHGEKIVLGKSAAYINLIEGINKLYVYNLLQTEFIKDYLNDELTGSTIKNLGIGSIKKIPIPLPPLLEQKAIADVLSDSDALIAAIEKKIAKKRLIKQGAMQELLRPKEGWNKIPFNKIFSFYSTSNYSKAQMSLEGEIGCLHYGLIHSIENVHYDLSKGVKYYVNNQQAHYDYIRNGDVIMVDASEDLDGINKSIEVLGIDGNKFISGLHTYLIRDIDSELVDGYRGIVLNSPYVKRQMLKLAVGMKVFGVSKTQMVKLEIPVPDSLNEQERIASILSDMDAEIEILEKQLAKYKEIKQGLMQNLLTGKIRLV